MNFLCLLTWRVEHQFAGRKIQTSWEASLPPHVASGKPFLRQIYLQQSRWFELSHMKLFLVIHVGLWGPESRQKEWWASQLSTSHLHPTLYYVICHFLRNLPSQETVTSKPVYVGHGVWAMNAKFHCPLFRCLRFLAYGSQYGGHKVLAMSTKLKCLHILNFWCLTF